MSEDDTTFTVDERTEMSQAFDAGNYAGAYGPSDLSGYELYEMPEHKRAAFVLGFFGSYTLDEIGAHREVFDECYHSRAGRYVVTIANYIDDRTDEYATESGKE